MKLILTRHGLTEENIKGIMGGQIQGNLSKKGIEQAKMLGLRLKNEKIDHIYSSDLRRAADTAKEIAKFHPDTPIEFVKELRECGLGVMEGKTKQECGFKEGERPPIELRETCEGFDVLFNRSKSFIEKTLVKHKNQTVLFVAHNLINRAIISAITGKTYKEVPFMKACKNTSLTIFEIEEGISGEIKDHKFILNNCVKHLE